MIDIDSIRTQISTWQKRWPHLVLVSLEAHPTTVQTLGVTKVDGLPLEAAPWMTSRERFYFLYRRDGQLRQCRISNDDANAVALLAGEPGKPRSEFDEQHAAVTRERGVPEAARAGTEQPWAPRGEVTADFKALKEMRDARDAEAVTADRTARLYDAVLGWALGVEAEAARSGLPPQDYLARGSVSDHALWLAVAGHRERYPASAGPAAVSEHAASTQSPSLRPWAPVREVSLRLGSAAKTLAQLADLPDDRVGDGFLAGPVARVEALAYRDAVRVGLAALRGDGRVYRRTYRVLEDLAVARRVHDSELGQAVDVLLDQLAHRLLEDSSPSMTPEQGAVLARCFQIGFGELQARVIRGDEDDHLVEMIDAFDAYFEVCRAKLGHDRVPISTWETYTAIKHRNGLVDHGAHV